MNIPKALAEAAMRVASDIQADGILISAEGDFQQLLALFDRERELPRIIVVTSAESPQPVNRDVKVIKIPAWRPGLSAKIAQAVARAQREGHLKKGERLVCLVGDGMPGKANTLVCHEITGDEKTLEEFFDPLIEAVTELAIEIATTEMEGRQLGAAFIIGDADSVLKLSTQLMINPFENHEVKIQDKNVWELIKKYAALDGAFVIDRNGIVRAAHCKLEAGRKVDIPRGLGTRHRAVAAMSLATDSVGVTVSQEDRRIRIFKKGRMIAQIEPKRRVIEWFKDSD